MRLIKFRGKHLDNGEWVYGSYVECWQHTYEGDAHPVHQICDKDGDAFNIHPETVGQFTGLFDKNGTEIYEGDIVKSISGSLDVISYDEIAFNLMTAYAAAPNGTCVSFFGKNNPLKGIEIIGNLHDNPELLKTE